MYVVTAQKNALEISLVQFLSQRWKTEETLLETPEGSNAYLKFLEHH